MNRKIPLKFFIPMVVILLALLYYFAFHIPLTNKMEELETQQAELDSKLTVAQAQVAEKNNMLAELEALEQSGAAQREMPQYNNIDRMLLELNTIMSGTDNYSISFSDASADNNIARRTLSVSFTVPTYDAVVSKIKDINTSENRYLITDMSLSRGINNEIITGNTDSFVSANLTLTSFEYVSPNGEQPPKSEEEIQAEKEAQLAALEEEEE